MTGSAASSHKAASLLSQFIPFCRSGRSAATRLSSISRLFCCSGAPRCCHTGLFDFRQRILLLCAAAVALPAACTVHHCLRMPTALSSLLIHCLVASFHQLEACADEGSDNELADACAAVLRFCAGFDVMFVSMSSLRKDPAALRRASAGLNNPPVAVFWWGFCTMMRRLPIFRAAIEH